MKPILFNTQMVRALLEGRKTVTRRVVRFKGGQNPAWSGYIPDGAVLYGSNNIPAAKAPYQPGDVLWVRETWSISNGACLYRAFPGAGMEPDKQDATMQEMGLKWRPSIHMPREAARIFLRVAGVRVERLQDVKYFDCLAEGIPYRQMEADIVQDFAALWDRTIKPADLSTFGWAANPWVWVIEFERTGPGGTEEGGT